MVKGEVTALREGVGLGLAADGVLDQGTRSSWGEARPGRPRPNLPPSPRKLRVPGARTSASPGCDTPHESACTSKKPHWEDCLQDRLDLGRGC